MCYPSPGPRCANHINKQIEKNESLMKDAVDRGDKKALAALKEDQSKQWHEFSGTHSGQKSLQQKIDRETDPSVRNALENYKIARREDYLQKMKDYKLEAAKKLVNNQAPVKTSKPATNTSSQSYSGKGMGGKFSVPAPSASTKAPKKAQGTKPATTAKSRGSKGSTTPSVPTQAHSYGGYGKGNGRSGMGGKYSAPAPSVPVPTPAVKPSKPATQAYSYGGSGKGFGGKR